MTTTDILLLCLLAVSVGQVCLLVMLWRRPSADPGRQEAAVLRVVDETRRAESALGEAIARLDANSDRAMGDHRKELRESMTSFQQTLSTQLVESARRLEALGTMLETRLRELQAGNEQKLEQMRQTVDEKLQATLRERLGESFKVVSENLERVTRGLGEMQQIAQGVGDLKRVLTNVKTRGTWGEIQLGQLLDQILVPAQFERNVAPRPGSDERVEFALRLPGAGEGEGPVWLPIDAKFPQEDYQRLVDAIDRADAEATTTAAAALGNRIVSQARDIQSKYIAPPHTTDFSILYLPTEGLYAEVLRQPGLAERLQTDHRVVVAGPMTLAALLNSLQMGFRTLAIQKRSSEVWQVLGAVKTEFENFGTILAKVRKKLVEAGNHLDATDRRGRAITRTLRDVEAMPTAGLLPEMEEAEAGEEEADEG